MAAKLPLSESVIERIDNGLELYYHSFIDIPYRNDDNIGKFKAYCSEEYGSDEEEIINEMDGEAKDCTLVKFEEDDMKINHFPLNPPIEDEEQRDHAIYIIMKHCYLHGVPPIQNTLNTTFTPHNLYSFTKHCFQHVLEHITASKRIYPKGKQWRTNTLKLNERKNHKKLNVYTTKTDPSIFNVIEIKLNDQLKYLIGISQHKKNDLFNKDLMILLIDSYYRYSLITETQNIQKRVYAQVYWRKSEQSARKSVNKMQIFTKFKFISNIKADAEAFYQEILKKRDVVGVLYINGEYQTDINQHKHRGIDALCKYAEEDYRNPVFRFMSSNRFYWELVRHKDIKLFTSAFNHYASQICPPLSLKNINKINDNIFIYWMYIWCMSNVAKTYMGSGDITIPLQIDLVILPNNNEHNKYIDDISERFNIHNLKFESVLCDSTNIDSIKQKLETVFIKISVKMKKKEHRIVIIVDRRSRTEYFKDKHCDRIYGYKPHLKYAQIDKRFEVINAVYNTSNYIIPGPPKYNQLIGAKSNNFFVLTYFIRKKAQFTKVFDYKVPDDKEDSNEQINISQFLALQEATLNALPDEDEKSVQSRSPTASLQSGLTIDTSEAPWPEADFVPKTPIGKVIMQKMHQRGVTSTQITHLMSEVQKEITDEMSNKKARAMSIANIQEYKALEDYIIQVALSRKRDTVCNMYLYYNRGYIRFEPLDLIRILPQFFNGYHITDYDKMLNDFKTYHDKLWMIDDDIWMKYKQIYLRSKTAMKQKVVIENVGTDPSDREIIRKYCIWKKDNEEFKEKYFKVMPLHCKLDKFVSWRSRNDGKGIIINKVLNQDYSDDLKVNDGELWSIMAINGTEICELRANDIEQMLNRVDLIKGYEIKIFGGLFSICDGTENKEDERVIRLSIKLNKFLKWSVKSKGIKIKEIDHNDYGVAFKQSGVVQGWYIQNIQGTNVSRMTQNEFELFLRTINTDNGYKIRFIYPTKNLLPSGVRRSSIKLND